MFETPITVVGRLTNDPTRRTAGDQDVVKFRLASNTRRRTAEGDWQSGNTLYLNVNCWGQLVTGVAASLRKGDAVIVVGNVHTNEYDGRDGIHRQTLEMRARAGASDAIRALMSVNPAYLDAALTFARRV